LAEYCQKEDHEKIEIQRHADSVDSESSGSRHAEMAMKNHALKDLIEKKL
jgi:hypothetical protein